MHIPWELLDPPLLTSVVVLVEFHVTPKDVTQFLEEATIMKDFTHQHVLHLLGVAIDDDRVYVVLPYMENGDLKSFISNDANVSVKPYDGTFLIQLVYN